MVIIHISVNLALNFVDNETVFVRERFTLVLLKSYYSIILILLLPNVSCLPSLFLSSVLPHLYKSIFTFIYNKMYFYFLFFILTFEFL